MALTLDLVPAEDGWLVNDPASAAPASRYPSRAEAEADALEYVRHRGGGRVLVRNQAGEVALTLRPDGMVTGVR